MAERQRKSFKLSEPTWDDIVEKSSKEKQREIVNETLEPINEVVESPVEEQVKTNKINIYDGQREVVFGMNRDEGRVNLFANMLTVQSMDSYHVFSFLIQAFPDYVDHFHVYSATDLNQLIEAVFQVKERIIEAQHLNDLYVIAIIEATGSQTGIPGVLPDYIVYFDGSSQRFEFARQTDAGPNPAITRLDLTLDQSTSNVVRAGAYSRHTNARLRAGIATNAGTTIELFDGLRAGLACAHNFEEVDYSKYLDDVRAKKVPGVELKWDDDNFDFLRMPAPEVPRDANRVITGHWAASTQMDHADLYSWLKNSRHTPKAPWRITVLKHARASYGNKLFQYLITRDGKTASLLFYYNGESLVSGVIPNSLIRNNSMLNGIGVAVWSEESACFPGLASGYLYLNPADYAYIVAFYSGSWDKDMKNHVSINNKAIIDFTLIDNELKELKLRGVSNAEHERLELIRLSERYRTCEAAAYWHLPFDPAMEETRFFVDSVSARQLWVKNTGGKGPLLYKTYFHKGVELRPIPNGGELYNQRVDKRLSLLSQMTRNVRKIEGKDLPVWFTNRKVGRVVRSESSLREGNCVEFGTCYMALSQGAIEKLKEERKSGYVALPKELPNNGLKTNIKLTPLKRQGKRLDTKRRGEKSSR